MKSEVAQSCPTLCDPMDCSLTRFLCPWDFPGKNTGVDCHFLLQGIFPTQGWNPGLPHCRQKLYHRSHQGRSTFQVVCFKSALVLKGIGVVYQLLHLQQASFYGRVIFHWQLFFCLMEHFYIIILIATIYLPYECLPYDISSNL